MKLFVNQTVEESPNSVVDGISGNCFSVVRDDSIGKNLKVESQAAFITKD